MAYDVLTFLSGLAGALLIAGAFTRWLWPLGAIVVIWVSASLVLGRLYPEAIQRLTVDPNEYAQEAPYITNNINMTRLAFGLDRWDVRPYTGTAPLTFGRIALICGDERLRGHADGRQCLADGIVQVACEALPFAHDGRLARLVPQAIVLDRNGQVIGDDLDAAHIVLVEMFLALDVDAAIDLFAVDDRHGKLGGDIDGQRRWYIPRILRHVVDHLRRALRDR